MHSARNCTQEFSNRTVTVHGLGQRTKAPTEPMPRPSKSEIASSGGLGLAPKDSGAPGIRLLAWTDDCGAQCIGAKASEVQPSLLWPFGPMAAMAWTKGPEALGPRHWSKSIEGVRIAFPVPWHRKSNVNTQRTFLSQNKLGRFTTMKNTFAAKHSFPFDPSFKNCIGIHPYLPPPPRGPDKAWSPHPSPNHKLA